MQLLKWQLKGVAVPTAVLVPIADEYAEVLLETRDNFTKPGEVPEMLKGKFTVDNFGNVTPAVKGASAQQLKKAADSEKADMESKKASNVNAGKKKASDQVSANEAEQAEQEALKRSKSRAAKVQGKE